MMLTLSLTATCLPFYLSLWVWLACSAFYDCQSLSVSASNKTSKNCILSGLLSVSQVEDKKKRNGTNWSQTKGWCFFRFRPCLHTVFTATICSVGGSWNIMASCFARIIHYIHVFVFNVLVGFWDSKSSLHLFWSLIYSKHILKLSNGKMWLLRKCSVSLHLCDCDVDSSCNLFTKDHVLYLFFSVQLWCTELSVPHSFCSSHLLLFSSSLSSPTLISLVCFFLLWSLSFLIDIQSGDDNMQRNFYFDLVSGV